MAEISVGVAKETYPGETRVALVPASVIELGRRKIHVVVEQGAGVAAGYPDAWYAEKGATHHGTVGAQRTLIRR